MPANRAFLGSGGFNGTAGRIQWEFAPELAERLLNAVVAMLMAIYRQYGFLPAKNFAGMLKRRKVGIITAGLRV